MVDNPSAAQYLVQHLIDEEIRYVFGITGDTVLPILDAMHDRQDEIRYVTCRMEHGATAMADAYSRVTGKPGCARCSTSGPASPTPSWGPTSPKGTRSRSSFSRATWTRFASDGTSGTNST